MESIRVTGIVPASPAKIYRAWLESSVHAAFTGGLAATIDPRIGGEYTAADGYIRGKTLELDANKRIVQTWRSTDFAAGDPDSRLEVKFARRGDGTTEITFLHTGIPDGQGSSYENGWIDHYLTPMRKYFTKQAAAEAAGAEAKAKGAKGAKVASKPAPAPKKAPKIAAPAKKAPKIAVATAAKKAPAKKAPPARAPAAKKKAIPTKLAATKKKPAAAKKKPAAAKKKPAAPKAKASPKSGKGAPPKAVKKVKGRK